MISSGILILFMRTRWQLIMKILFIWFIWTGIYGNSFAFPLLPNVSQKMENPSFWINKIKNPDLILLSFEKIQKMNEENLKRKEFYLCSVRLMKEDWTKEEILNLLKEDWEGFGQKPGMRYGRNGIPLGESFWNGIKENWNQETLKETNRILFGMVIKRTDIRVFPTDEPSLASPNHSDFDQFQHSMIGPGSLVGIYHFSRDHRWAYVQTSFIRGWIRVEDLAIARRKEEILEDEKEFLVTTGNFVKIYKDPFFKDLAFTAQMGSKFPLLSPPGPAQTFVPSYIVKIPQRMPDGFLSFRNGYIPIYEDIHRGFLPYTQKNVALQAFKMLSYPYGWGEMGGGRDCSRFIMDLFNTFGIFLPRNSKFQAMVGTPLLSKDAWREKEKLLALDRAVPLATLIRTPGHIMLYLGKHRGKYYVIHSLWGFQTGGDWIHPSVKKVGRVIVSDLSLGKEGPHGSLFDRITEIQFIGDESFLMEQKGSP